MTPRTARTRREPADFSRGRYLDIASAPGPPGWRDSAACRGLPPRKFFPTRGDNETMRAAKAVCATCPVAEQCAADGLGEKWGVWGGRSEKQRRAQRGLLRRAGNPSPAIGPARPRRRLISALDSSPQADAMTKAEVTDARDELPVENPTSEPDATELPLNADSEPDPTALATCKHCDKPLPPGWHRLYCDDDCMVARDRARRATSNGKPNPKPKLAAGARANGAPKGAALNGVGSVVNELLALKAVGEVEIEVAGTRLLVRPRA